MPNLAPKDGKGLPKAKHVWRVEVQRPTNFSPLHLFCSQSNSKTQTLLPDLSLACVDAAPDIKSARLRNKIKKKNKNKHESFKIVQRDACVGLIYNKNLLRVQPSHKTQNQ